MVHQPPGASRQARDGGSRCPRGAVHHGADRGGARSRRHMGGRPRSAALHLRHRELRRCTAHGAGPRRPHRGAVDRPAGAIAKELSRDRPPRRQAFSNALTRHRAPGRGSRAGGVRLAREPRQPRPEHPHRVRDQRRVLLLQQGAGSRRAASRGERPCRVPPVWRHRLAGRCVADDAPRLLRVARALSQLSVS